MSSSQSPSLLTPIRTLKERNALILDNMGLIGCIVRKLSASFPEYVDRKDLYSAGLHGLIDSATRYRKERGTFAAYAYLRIRGAIVDELRRQDFAPRWLRGTHKKAAQAASEIEQRTGRPATDAEIRQSLNMSPKHYRKRVLMPMPQFIDLDGHIHDSATRLHEVIPDSQAPAGGETMMRDEQIAVLKRKLDCLPAKEQRVLRMYYFEDKGYAEIGTFLGVSESRACQLHKMAICRLKVLLGLASND